jgi:hypothetical protein
LNVSEDPMRAKARPEPAVKNFTGAVLLFKLVLE